MTILRRSLAVLALLLLSQPLLAYYCPTTGRFLSRDPIGEQGGENLYAFVRNRPCNRIDVIGLAEQKHYGSYKCECDRSVVNKLLVEMARKAGKMSMEDINNVPEQIRKHGLSSGREFGGRICCNRATGEVTATGPSVSRSGPSHDGWIKQLDHWEGRTIDISAATPRCPKGTTEVARYHSHPHGSSEFSTSDLNSAAGDKRPFALGTPDGTVSIIEPILGNRILPNDQGVIPNVTLKIIGWGVNDDGSLYRKPVIPTDGSHSHMVAELPFDYDVMIP